MLCKVCLLPLFSLHFIGQCYVKSACYPYFPPFHWSVLCEVCLLPLFSPISLVSAMWAKGKQSYCFSEYVITNASFLMDENYTDSLADPLSVDFKKLKETIESGVNTRSITISILKTVRTFVTINNSSSFDPLQMCIISKLILCSTFSTMMFALSALSSRLHQFLRRKLPGSEM